MTFHRKTTAGDRLDNGRLLACRRNLNRTTRQSHVLAGRVSYLEPPRLGRYDARRPLSNGSQPLEAHHAVYRQELLLRAADHHPDDRRSTHADPHRLVPAEPAARTGVRATRQQHGA